MSFFTTKVILGALLFLSGMGAAFTMLSLMGKTEQKTGSATLRKLHRIFGFIFFILIFVLAVMGLKYWASMGENLSTRAVIHAVLALSLLIVFLVKVIIIQFYKQFLKLAPTLGLMVFCLSFVVFIISGGYYILRKLSYPSAGEKSNRHTEVQIQGSLEQGREIFNRFCLICHATNSDENKMGPSLMGLSKNGIMPHTGKPVTFDNIKQQLFFPVLMMPAFKDLAEQEIADLTAFLKTL